MKKLKHEECILAKKREDKLNRRKRIKLGKVSRKKQKKNKQTFNNNYISFPEKFCIYYDQSYRHKGKEYYDQKKFIKTMGVIEKIKKFVPKDLNDTLKLNFSLCERISAAALLLLYNAIESFTKEYNRKVIIYRLPRDTHASHLLKRSGFIKICNLQENVADFSLDKVPIITGIGGEYRDKIVDFIQNKIYGNNMSSETEWSFGDAIQETFANVTRHAYPNEENEEDKRWWLICDLYGDDLNLAIYDSGIGIPNTVVENKWFNKILKVSAPKLKIQKSILNEIINSTNINKVSLNKLTEWHKIFIAMQPDASSTKELKHGQGSKSIKALVEKNNGKLTVYSNKGLYFTKDGSSNGRDLEHSIFGTLIQWNIKVAK
ncbi:ATP-binding protein [Gilliamella sp. Occ4-3]|uniref:ATP-binding protein n=1 Tax=Gilliamella sp. Occ4-3 TaxID=3120254 RepID=UPI00117A588B|nr:ATP-binding protein [Gilliamella apicola]